MELKLRNVLIGLAIVIVFLIIVVIVFSPPKTYKNNEYGFSINPPKGWKIQENIKMDNFTIPVAFIGPVEKNFAVNINIYIEKINETTLQEYVNLNKKILTLVVSSYNLISERNTTINNHEAYELLYTAKIKNTDLAYKQIFLIKNNSGYVITFTALKDNFDKYIVVFDKSIETFIFF
jgi:hypothetical protein